MCRSLRGYLYHLVQIPNIAEKLSSRDFFSDSTSILLLEVFYLVALGFAAGFAQNYVESFIEKLQIDLMEAGSGTIDHSMHSNVLKLKNMELCFSAFGCFNVDLKVIKTVYFIAIASQTKSQLQTRKYFFQVFVGVASYMVILMQFKYS